MRFDGQNQLAIGAVHNYSDPDVGHNRGKNYNKDLRTFRRESSSELENDWNVYFNVSSYF